MGVFDDLGATISSAEQSAVSFVSNGIASGLSAVTGALGGAFAGLTGAVTSLFGGNNGAVQTSVKLPLPNPLFAYATYNYVIGLASITDKFLNDPDNTYRKGMRADLICKSASADPTNRVQTAYGSFEFYIDDVKIHSQIGQEAGANTNAVGNITFKIIEPYSMGMFHIALQTVAQKNGHKNWNEAPFLLTIDFRGNTETGQIVDIPGVSRQIPITFSTMSMKITQEGAVYDCVTLVYNQQAISDAYNKFSSDLAIKGKTVREMLQTGEKSLQAVLNQKLKEVAELNGITKQDQILILFPQQVASSKTSSASTDASNSSDTATVNTTASVDAALLKRLDVSQDSKDANLIQDSTTVNAIGAAKMGFDELRKGDAPVGKDNQVYDKEKKVNVPAKNSVDPAVTDMKFRQDTDILNAISQVIMQSTFINSTLDASQITPEGYKDWWNIDVQTYTNGDVNKATGQKPKLLVYRVIPYAAHASSGVVAANVKPPGYEELKKQAVKQYNYIYTGKNVDILKFEINYQANFQNLMPADGGKKTQDKNNPGSDGADPAKDSDLNSLRPGSTPSTKPGVESTSVSFVQTLFKSDKLGGGGNETEATRAARAFNDSLTKGQDMITLDMEIIGDPYYIVQSGTGNYTAKPTQYANLTDAGDINYQSGEVDILVNFRTPIDINQTTGLYDFSKGASAPVELFSGLYMVRIIDSTFSKNEFKQTLQLQRRPLQSAEGPGTTHGTLSTSNPTTPKPDPGTTPPQATYNSDGTVNASDPNGSGEST